MKYTIIDQIAESRMFPSKKSFDREDFESLSEDVFILIIALRILLTEDQLYAHQYVRRTISSSNFNNWRANGTDLYLGMHALSTGKYDDGDEYPETISMLPIFRWLKAMNRSDGRDETETRRLFLRMERLLFIRDTSLKAIRRLVMDWPKLTSQQRRLSTTRLLQIFRSRAPRADVLAVLSQIARNNNWEMMNVCDPERETCGDDGDDHGHRGSVSKGGYKHPLSKAAGFAAGAAGAYALFRNKVKESDCGTTGASSIAGIAVPLGGIGPGFSGKGGDKGIYQDISVIRRGDAPKKPTKK